MQWFQVATWQSFDEKTELESDRWKVKGTDLGHKAHIGSHCVSGYNPDTSAAEDSTRVTCCLLVSIPQIWSNLLVFICAQKVCAISINYGFRCKHVLTLLNGSYKSDTPLPEFPRSTHGRNITIFGQSGLFVYFFLSFFFFLCQTPRIRGKKNHLFCCLCLVCYHC